MLRMSRSTPGAALSKVTPFGAALKGACFTLDALLDYIENHAQDLVADLMPSLMDADPGFDEADVGVLSHNLLQCVRHFLMYAKVRDEAHLDAAFRFIQHIWPDKPLSIARVVRVLFGLEDLVAIRAQSRFSQPEVFVDALRAFRVPIREALCTVGEQVQAGRHRAETPTGRRQTPALAPIDAERPQPHQIARWLGRLKGGRFVGRSRELQTLWERFRAAAEGTGHEIVGLRGAQGVGRTRMLASFSDRVERLLGRPPAYLKAKGHHLFSLPYWPFIQLLKSTFDIDLGDANLGEKVARQMRALADFAVEDGEDGLGRQTLLDRVPDIQAFLGDGEATRMLEGTDPRTAGVRLREAVVVVFRAIAARAMAQTGAPLFLEFEDAEEMDAASWMLLSHLLEGMRSRARILVVLSYSEQFRVPPLIRQLRGYTEIHLKAFDMSDCEALIDGLLQPHTIEEKDRFRIITASMGSPLVLSELIRRLVESGHLSFEEESWRLRQPIPEGLSRDLSALVGARIKALDAGASPVLEVVAVIEDAMGAGVLEEVIARRGIDHHEMAAALDTLERAGLVYTEPLVRIRHPLIRDEVYRQMHPERRRAIHEDAAEVYARLLDHGAFPSLAASHHALAGQPGQAVSWLVKGVERALALHELPGALGLCHQAMGLLKGLPSPDQDRLLFKILLLREHIHGLMGAREAQGRDLHQLETLAPRVASQEERLRLAGRRARYALLTGSHAQVESLVLSVISDQDSGRPDWVRGRLMLALDRWQQGEGADAFTRLDEAVKAAGPELSVGLRSRLAHARGAFALRDGDPIQALEALEEAVLAHQDAGDVYGESLATCQLGLLCWSQGHLIAAVRLLRRAWLMVRSSEERGTVAWMMICAARLHATLGDFEAAARYLEPLSRDAAFDTQKEAQAEGTIIRGRILVNQSRYDEAMRVIGQCLKALARAGKRHPLYVDGLNALGLALVSCDRGEKLIQGALRYAGDALDKSMELDYTQGRVEALGVQIRGLLLMEQHAEARQRLKLMESVMGASDQPTSTARLKVELAWCQMLICESTGDGAGAADALTVAWTELLDQARCLKGTGYTRPFLRNVALHREIVDRVVLEERGA